MQRKSFIRNAILTFSFYVLNGKLFGFFSAQKRHKNNESSIYGTIAVSQILLGALTPFSVKATAKVQNVAVTQARLMLSISSTLSNPIYGPFAPVNAGNNYVAAMSIAGLLPGTRYWYAVDSDNFPNNATDYLGSFYTPLNSPFPFSFTVGADNLDPDHFVFLRMALKSPMFHITTGDFHYRNPNSATDINVHRAPYETLFSTGRLKNFLLNTPLVYMWDDHDFCGNDSNAASAGKTNARLAYQEYIPHYPLPAGGGDEPIYQAFTIGRIRFILTDLRSARESRTMLGAAQKAWFKSECRAARESNLVICWISSVSFGGDQPDNWGGFADERTELGDFFRDNGIKNLFILAGDAHMVAIDNGKNHDFSTGASNPYRYPVFQAAALNQSGSFKGGVYSEGGPFLNPDSTYGQYGVIEVFDDGNKNMTISMQGLRVNSTGGTETVLTTYSFSPGLAQGPLPIKVSSFNVSATQGGEILLAWKTEQDNGCREYFIERSMNGIDFTAISRVNCRGGSSSASQYSFIDKQPVNGIKFYRIKIVEIDNSFTFSQIKSIHSLTAFTVKISDNPVMGALHVIVDTDKKANASFAIYNMQSGLVFNDQYILLNPGSNHINCDVQQLASGSYIFTIVSGEKNVSKKFIIK